MLHFLYITMITRNWHLSWCGYHAFGCDGHHFSLYCPASARKMNNSLSRTYILSVRKSLGNFSLVLRICTSKRNFSTMAELALFRG